MTTIPPPPAAVPPPKKGGCWKWGCIGCSAALFIAAIGAFAIAMFVFGAIKSSDAYRGALRSVERDPQVIDALGTPIHAGFWVTGSVNVNNGQGNARIEFPVEGPKQRARVHAEATLESGAWHYTEIVVTPKSGPPINVRQP